MQNALIAIVIPAYKADYLKEALQSIANQRAKNFRVYVADDASPADLASICKDFEGALNLQYIRFDKNLGQTDLIAHWNRCVRISNEPWVWLFGDDDIMEPDCTKIAQDGINENRYGVSLFHFNVIKIDAMGDALSDGSIYPELISGRNFAAARFAGKLDSFAPDYVFARAAFEQIGGFVNFPLAWCSDDASWVAMAGTAGIHTLEGSRVRWRLSGQNISSPNPANGIQKVHAAVLYLKWLHNFFRLHSPVEGDVTDKIISKLAFIWFFNQIQYSRSRFGVRDAFQVSLQLKSLPPNYFGWLAESLRLVWRGKKKHARRMLKNYL